MKLKLSSPPTLNTHEEAVKYFISQMDIEMLNDILDNEKTYQDFSKEEFIARLGKSFNNLKDYKNTHLLIFPGYCDHCTCINKGKSGFIFYGNKSKHYLNLIFDVNDTGRVTDLHECNEFKETIKPKFKPRFRVYIDGFKNGPF